MRSYEKSSSWFAEGMQKFPERWKKKCIIDIGGEYFGIKECLMY